MSVVFLCAAIALGTPPEGGSLAVSQSASTVQKPAGGVTRSAAELRVAVHAALRQWARPGDSLADRAARDLLDLFKEVVEHPTLARESRKELALQLRSRLSALAQQITNRDAKSVAMPHGNRTILGQAAGPGAGMGAGAGNQSNPDAGSAGQDLVEVIRRTIAPGTWDVNGGQGAIMFWRQGAALVVRQTEEVHAEIGHLIGALEQAGR